MTMEPEGAGPSAGASASEPLHLLVARETRTGVAPELDAVLAMLSARFDAALAAVLFYGSCIRTGELSNGLVDVYVVVNDYRRAYRLRRLRLANRWLAPNVFYGEYLAPGGRPLRFKYAVVAMEHLEQAVESWFHPYLWGRLAQPLRVGWARDDAIRRRLEAVVAEAVRRFVRETAGCLEPPFSALDLWRQGLSLSYRSELRPEGADRAAELVAAQPQAYTERTAALAVGAQPLLDALGGDVYRIKPGAAVPKGGCRQRWRLRRLQGKGLSVARLLKAVFTFHGGVDYAAWKVERHTGVAVPVGTALRSHPIAFGLFVLWRLLSRRVLN